jgi:hypothetical protein
MAIFNSYVKLPEGNKNWKKERMHHQQSPTTTKQKAS